MIDPRIHKPVFQPHLIAAGLRDHATRNVVYFPDGTAQTGAEVADEISRYEQALTALGVRRGDRVALLSGNLPAALHVTNATMFNESSLVSLHAMGSVADHSFIAEDSGFDTIIFEPRKFAGVVRELKAAAPQIKRFLSLGPCDFAEDLIAFSRTMTPRPLVSPDLTGREVFRLAYSGGTTGKPKAIASTHASVTAMFEILLAEWEYPAEVRQLLCAPLSHSGTVAFLPSLLRGGSIHVLERFDPLEVFQAIEKYRITCILLVPTMIYALLDHPRIDEFDLSSLETIFYGASSMSVTRLKEGIQRFGSIFFQFYGQAEAPMTVTILRKAEHDPDNPLRLASCGRPVPWLDVALLDPEGKEVAEGEPGEICVRGPIVMDGYVGRPDLTEEVFRHGWLHTGDVGVRDADGFIRIVDRLKDMIITGGFNVYPREVEDALTSHPAVSAAGVFGIADDHWGEAVTAAVVLREGHSASIADLTAHVRAAKGVHQTPKVIHFLDALPLTPVGKPDKKALRARYS
jgi:acyl-CoA synthetase (AMP-forming)/AMP-acid ligase II